MPDWHEEISAELVDRLGRVLIAKGDGFGDMLLVVENVLVAVMRINADVFDLKPRVAAGLLEDCLQRATERFTDIEAMKRENRA